ncbi:hypothetical protein ACIRVF_26915 [Kitasatospora sp. NPDC101157]
MSAFRILFDFELATDGLIRHPSRSTRAARRSDIQPRLKDIHPLIRSPYR